MGRLRAGTTFCLRWLKHYYWKKYQVIQNSQSTQSHLVSPEPSGDRPIPLLACPAEVEHVVLVTSSDGGAIWKLTRGLCNTRQELTDLLTSSTYK